ncbi:MAG TPA: hypothetical protein VFL76_04825 [Edaphocola sp.]|nr:hypothetical protein [Edaphocola sp.]
MLHLIKPRSLPDSIYYSQLLNLKKTINDIKADSCKLWVPEKDADLEGADYFYSGKSIDRRRIYNGDMVYCRSAVDYFRTRIVLAGRRVKYIYDFRAIQGYEGIYMKVGLLNICALFILEFICYCSAHQVNAVSNNLAEKLHSLFLIHRKINILPCFTSYEPVIGVPPKGIINFVYVGGTSKWQCIEDIFRIYKNISAEFNSTLTFYTKDTIYITELAEKFKVTVACRYVQQNRLGEELALYDFGFLIRERNIINEVASPVKFLEYLSKGIIPIITEGIGDYSEVVKEKKIGVILKDNYDGIGGQIKDALADRDIYLNMFKYANEMTWANNKTRISKVFLAL